MSDSAGTSWLDTGKRAWSPELLAATNLDEKQMPTLVEGTEQGGKLRGELAARWGISGDVVVAGGAGDNAASACGMGTVSDGCCLRFARHVGRSLCRQRGLSAEARKRRSRLLPCAAEHLAPDGRHPLGDGCPELAFVASPASRPRICTGELGETLKAPTGVTFLPYLSGERTPHNDAVIRGAFIGLET